MELSAGLGTTAQKERERQGRGKWAQCVLCVLYVGMWSLLLTGCSSAPSRPILGTFTGDEQELAYLEQVRALSPTSLQRPESVHTALLFYRDSKLRQQSLFLQLHRQHPDATPREMTMLVRDALARENRADLVAMPPPSFHCSTVTKGKTESLSCN